MISNNKQNIAFTSSIAIYNKVGSGKVSKKIAVLEQKICPKDAQQLKETCLHMIKKNIEIKYPWLRNQVDCKNVIGIEIENKIPDRVLPAIKKILGNKSSILDGLSDKGKKISSMINSNIKGSSTIIYSGKNAAETLLVKLNFKA